MGDLDHVSKKMVAKKAAAVKKRAPIEAARQRESRVLGRVVKTLSRCV